ncbi:MAG: F0F1 ATP synthase subunit B [Patescibacteria group bacterium]
MEILTSLGVDWRLLVAQLVNFAILFFALYKLLYKPLLALLEKRTAKIEKGLADADAAEEKLKLTDQTYKQIVLKAKKEAEKILEEASALAEQHRQETVKQTREEVKRVVTQAKTRIEQEKQQMLEDAKKDIVDLVVQASASIAQTSGEKKISKDLAKKAVDRLKKNV